jgi:unsaturated rhamnogalacturonyl hydrolase
MKRLCLLLSFIASSYLSFSQTASATWSVKFADAMISRYSPTINAMTAKGWEYSNTIILEGMAKVYEETLDANYLNYIQAYVDAYVNSSGVISATVNSLDRTHPGLTCLFLYQKTGLLKYKTAATTLRNMYVGAGATYPKTAKGGIFWHKNNGSYNDIILIDGIYMLHPFLAKYGSLFSDNAAIDTAVNQTLYIYNQLYDNTQHLIKHGWNPTKTQTWANATTGNSSEVWSRGMGWYVMALVDILKYVPVSHPRRSELLTALSNLVTGIQTYQDAGSKLWYQVVDDGIALSGNYLETSGSAMFVYAIKTAVTNGWISSTYLPIAQNGWTALKTKISTYPTDGLPAINDFAPAMSVQNNAAAYVQASLQPVDAPSPIGGPPSGTQHPHGYAAIMMAASVMEFPLVTLPVKFTSISATLQRSNVLLKWQNTDYNEVANYVIERSEDGTNFTAIATLKPQSSYNQWTDVNAGGNISYYRIKAISFNNNIEYSKIVSVTNQSPQAQLNILPNPVQDGTIKIFIHGLNTGRYRLTISNSTGETIIRKSFSGKENLEENIHLPASSKGVLYVSVNGDKTILKKSILVH